MNACKTCGKVTLAAQTNCDQTTMSYGRTFRCGGILRSLAQGDLLRWTWKHGCEPTRTHDVYWCKSRTVVVLKDGRWVDTYWHSLNDSEHLWNSETEIRPEHVDATFLINTADLAPLAGPSEQYADGDTFYICNGGGGSWRNYMRKGAKPQRDRVLAILQQQLKDAQQEEQSARRCQERIAQQIVNHEAGEDVRL